MTNYSHESAPTQRVLGRLSENEALAYMTPPTMKGLLFISCFSREDPDSPAQEKHGYQRDPIDTRIPKIANYYASSHARTTPIIVSVRIAKAAEIDKFIELFDAGKVTEIHRRWGEAVVSIVDGQHRHLGILRAWEQDPSYLPRVPFLLNFGMSIVDEANFFNVINTNQQKLPKALIEVTKADISEVGDLTPAQRIRNIATALARDEDSVWHNDVNMTGARDPNRPVTFEGLRRSSASMFPKEILERLDDADRDALEVAKMFWRTVAEVCKEAWNAEPGIEIDELGKKIAVKRSYRIKELVGVAALARVARDIIASALEHPNFDQRLTDLTSKLHRVDWEKGKENPWMASQAGFAGQSDLYTVLSRLVYGDKTPV